MTDPDKLPNVNIMRSALRIVFIEHSALEGAVFLYT